MNAVQLSNVSHRYVTHWALVHIEFSVEKGACVAVLGPNGCGKSTFLKILATLLEPTLGNGTILEWDIKKNRDSIRSKVSWLGHDLGIYSTLTARENLKFTYGLRGEKSSPEKIDAVLSQVGLNGSKDKPVSSFSTGMRKRLALAKLLLQQGDLILLDEPHANLDKEAKSLMNHCISQWKMEKKTLFLASHDHHEVLPLCDKALVLNQGKAVYFGDPNKLPTNVIL